MWFPSYGHIEIHSIVMVAMEAESIAKEVAERLLGAKRNRSQLWRKPVLARAEPPSTYLSTEVVPVS
ncbi:MAG: hypothetical protein E5W86_21685 [Mesorhizobium sp.]|nr:MAG: hypothetical protein E5W86_21685 [Mesorhizobium sp.]